MEEITTTGTATPTLFQRWPWLTSKSLLAFLGGLLAILVLGLGVIWLRAGRPLMFGGQNLANLPDTARLLINAPKPTPTPALTPSWLTGVLVTPEAANLRPLGVMIENHQDARPQSGLSQADLVYEAIAEGGITRFLAIFADPRADIRVGPVRSARTYFVDWATELGAFYAHVGGSSSALKQIAARPGFYDLNQFSVGSPTFWRDLSQQVATEHTMYSSTAKLWQYATATRKYNTKASFTPWKFTDAPAADSRPTTAQTITVDFSSPQFRVGWTYDPAANTYTRSLAGKPHSDAINNKSITAKTVILHTVAHQMVSGDKGSEWKLSLTGSGSARVFMNGVETAATWQKAGANRTQYFDSSGKELVLPRGNIWVEIIHPETSVSVTTPSA